jgi:hypothetical protein
MMGFGHFKFFYFFFFLLRFKVTIKIKNWHGEFIGFPYINYYSS